MGHLAPPKLELDANFEAMRQKVFSMSHLDGVVMVTNVYAKLYLFFTLLRLISLLLLRLLILILSVVNDTTHWRFRMRSNLDKIKTKLLGFT